MFDEVRTMQALLSEGTTADQLTPECLEVRFLSDEK